MEPKSLKHELWREYEWYARVYRINDPVTLWIGTTTHRVLDSDGVVHCVPTVGERGCALRWKPRDPQKSVAF